MITKLIANEPKLVWPGGAILGEGPVWVDREAALYWVDIKSCLIHRFDPIHQTKKSWKTEIPIGAIHPAADGNFIGALKNGFYKIMLDPTEQDARVAFLANPEPSLKNNRFNDAKVGPDGSLWAGSMDDQEVNPTGSLYRMTQHGITKADDGYVITNGPAFSPNGQTLYHTDTLARKIYAFDLTAHNSLSNKRVFTEIPAGEGYPDGMCTDDEGCLWVCHWGGARLTRHAPSGEVLTHIKMPVANITSCTFGGKNLKTLFVTTASKGLSAKELKAQPDAGALYAIDVNISGPATKYYDGGFTE